MTSEAYAVIPLTQGKSAIVDVTSMPLVEGKRWYATKQHNYWYAGYSLGTSSYGNKKTFIMHRLILNLTKGDGKTVDHINRDGLDNRKTNLRICTDAQNKANSRRRRNSTNPYRGVSFDARKDTLHKRWEACIAFENKQVFLGRYATAKEAAWAYDLAAIRYHGDFAQCNFIKEMVS